MEQKEIYSQLAEIVDKSYILTDEPMSKHTTFRIGGAADYFVMPSSKEEVQKVVDVCKKQEMPYYIIGNGSNLLVGDKGYRGVIIHMNRAMGAISIQQNIITAQAGALLSKIAKEAVTNNLAGFEFAAGIPGTIGGAVMMNAGAYGGEMKDIISSVTVLTAEGELVVLAKEEMDFGYRTSIVAKKGYIVLEVTIQLEGGEQVAIQEIMDDLKSRRIDKQPLEFPSSGSTFKRPDGFFAGKLIDDAGLCGLQVGQAAVSEKHCGFVINKGNATAMDVIILMDLIIEKVQEQFGVTLEPEVKRIGEF